MDNKKVSLFLLVLLPGYTRATSQLAITLQLQHVKDGLGCDTSKSDHKTAARKHKGSNCREGTITATVWALMPYQHNPYMARVVHLFAGSEGPVWGQEFCLFVQIGFLKKWIQGDFNKNFKSHQLKVLQLPNENIMQRKFKLRILLITHFNIIYEGSNRLF